MRIGLGMSLTRPYGFGSAPAFDPVTLAPSVLYDPSDLATLFQASSGTGAVSANADPIGYLADKSGNAKHMLQATAGARPLLSTAGGLKSVKFDGTDDQLAGPVLSDFISASEFDIVVAGRFNTVGTDALIPYDNDAIIADASSGWLTIGARSSGFIRAGAGADIQSAYTIGSAAVIHLRLLGGTLSLTINNGVAVTTALASVGNVAGSMAIGKALHAASFADLDFYALFARKTALSAPNLASVKEWAAAKAGVTL